MQQTVAGLWNSFIHCIRWTRTTETIHSFISLLPIHFFLDCIIAFVFIFVLSVLLLAKTIQFSFVNITWHKEMFLSLCHNRSREILCSFSQFLSLTDYFEIFTHSERHLCYTYQNWQTTSEIGVWNVEWWR